MNEAHFTVNYPKYAVTPSDSILDGSEYGTSSRAGSLTGIYGDNNGTFYQNNGIIDETNNTYYNPVTGDTNNITSWTYDYGDRSYTVTTEDNDVVTITYGDENITISEGDTVYNIYYIINNGTASPTPAPSGEPSSTPAPDGGDHWHNWELTTDNSYCTLPGEKIYTCSVCGETKTDEVQVLGHSWTILRQVHTHYDENGEQDQEGYILYECSRCGEQYKAPSGGSPPGSNDQTPGGSSSGTSSGLSRVFANSAATISNPYDGENHTGTDVVPASGTVDTVIAHSEGEVVWVQTGQANNPGSSGNESYGNAVKIKHNNGYYTLYAHLASVYVEQGQHVYKGDALGIMGNTGNSYGSHLHFEVHDTEDQHIDSGLYINADLPNFSGGGISGSSGSSSEDGGIWGAIGNLLGSLFGGLITIAGRVATAIFNALAGLVNVVVEGVGNVAEAVVSLLNVIPTFFEGFTGFLAEMFPYLPEEIVSLLTFGIAAVVLIGIIKAVRR